MKTKRQYRPNIVGKGKALPLGNNYYYMKGPKHANGGIKIGNSKNGIEVEGGEIMHVAPSETKVFSSVPFLRGVSPVEKVLGGHNPNKVFQEQENYKDKNNLNDDGTKKNNKGSKKYIGGGNIPSLSKYRYKFGDDRDVEKETMERVLPKYNLRDIREQPIAKPKPLAKGYNTPNKLDYKVPEHISTGRYIKNKVSNFLEDHPNFIGDIAGTGSNIIGAIAGYKINKKAINSMRYAKRPTATKAAKLKTKININSQLDKMRETIGSYERTIDANTASSKVAQQRKLNANINKILMANKLYEDKENKETQLINQDKLNAQHVAQQNAYMYQRWAEGKAAFENAKAEKLAENEIGLTQNLVGSIQDLIVRSDTRRRERNDLDIEKLKSPTAARYYDESLKEEYNKRKQENSVYKRAKELKKRNNRNNKK